MLINLLFDIEVYILLLKRYIYIFKLNLIGNSYLCYHNC